MVSIPAYYDGKTVRTIGDFPFVKNQKLIITVLDAAFSEHELQPKDKKNDALYRLSLLADLQKYRGRLSPDFDAEKEAL